MCSRKQGNNKPKQRHAPLLEGLVKAFKGQVFLISGADGSWGWVHQSQQFLVSVLKWIYTRPDVVRRFIDFYTKRAIEAGKAAIDEGAHGIYMGTDYANSEGPWMSPQKFREFVKPALKKQVEAFHKKAPLHYSTLVATILP